MILELEELKRTQSAIFDGLYIFCIPKRMGLTNALVVINSRIFAGVREPTMGDVEWGHLVFPTTIFPFSFRRLRVEFAL